MSEMTERDKAREWVLSQDTLPVLRWLFKGGEPESVTIQPNIIYDAIEAYHQHIVSGSALVSAVSKGIVHRMGDEGTLTIHWSDLTDDEGEAVIKAINLAKGQ
jgi:hypothetical protein